MKQRILLLAPHPFFVERGTPIAVRYLVRELISQGDEVDLVTFAGGEDFRIDGLRIYRTPAFGGWGEVPIGFSFAKLIGDFFLTIRAIGCVLKQRYQIIHAVEEAVYPALWIGAAVRTPVVYDLDSSMADQLLEKWKSLRAVGRFFYFAESVAMRGANGLAPVCPALEERVRSLVPAKPIRILHDVFVEGVETAADLEDVREGLPEGGLLVLYVGNLEHYQGVELLYAAARNLPREVVFIIIGGSDEKIEEGREAVRQFGVEEQVRFLGPRPMSLLGGYLRQADALVSPRLLGVNTPMKLYAYLASERPVIATEIVSHTQVVGMDQAILVPATSEGISDGVRRLLAMADRGKQIGEAGARLVRDRYSKDGYSKNLRLLYDGVLSPGAAGPIV
ncbi:MAG: glycosyltransferase family 4 protein [Puniceicoccaceae bacterium]